MKNLNRDVNICENEISLLKERYITTLNNNLLSDNESDDSDSSLTTINSITTCYTEGSISDTESVLTYTSSMLERLNFSPLEETSITSDHFEQRSTREQIVADCVDQEPVRQVALMEVPDDLTDLSDHQQTTKKLGKSY